MSAADIFRCSRWKRSRAGFAIWLILSLWAGCSVLRLVLLFKFGMDDHPSAGSMIAAVLIGVHFDVMVAVFATLPLLLWFVLVPDRLFGRLWHRILLMSGCFVFWSVQVFLFFTEYYFFDEFKSRFNTVAVDYLLYPSEVFGNIRESYPLTTVVIVCCLAGAGWVAGTFFMFRGMWEEPRRLPRRFLDLALASVLCLALAPTVSLSGTHFSQDRTLNEVANNGSLSFINAAWTHNLDYAANYKTLPRDEAYARTRRLLSATNATFAGPGCVIRRTIAGDAARPKLNVVILLEESLGSEFWGSLGRPGETLTPCMDKLAVEDGLFFTNMYACGNRTVRGFEGVLSSFPPLPGDSIVKRDRSENVESIARILKRDGYSTVFLYGGRGWFDSMRSYAVRNGWDRFIEEKDFPNPTFKTIWGVCDEDTYNRGIEEFRALAQAGKPFLGTIMSVSNHKPYWYPTGRIPEDPMKPQPTREKAVKYSDWCLGDFFAKAKKEAFWTNTVFVVVADHGARVYGSQAIPIFSYEIPCVILGPAVVKSPHAIGILANSLDVAPTVLGLIGRPYETLFFGRDLLHGPDSDARALLNHNRDIGMYTPNRMVVLGMHGSVEYYKGDPKVAELAPVRDPDPAYLELERSACAIYQVADDLYMNRQYRIDGER